MIPDNTTGNSFPLAGVQSYLENFSKTYPGIADWFGRVASGADGRSRSIYVFSGPTTIYGLAVLKHGTIGKLCHLSIDKRLRGLGLATCLVSQAVRELYLRGSSEIVVTTSESTRRRFGGFFSGVGFSEVDWTYGRYVHGVSEIAWAASSGNLMDRIARRSIEGESSIQVASNRATFHSWTSWETPSVQSATAC